MASRRERHQDRPPTAGRRGAECIVIARWTAALLLAIGCRGQEPARPGVAAILRALPQLPMGGPITPARLHAWGRPLGLPACEVHGWDSDEVGVGHGVCSIDRVVLDGGEMWLAFELRREQWTGHDALFLTGLRLAQTDVELMSPDGRRPDGIVPRAAREVWGAPTATCDGLSAWALLDRVAFLSAVAPDHEPDLVVEAPPRIDGRALACLASGQSPTRTNGAR